MSKRYYAVTLHPNTPKELLSLIYEYLHTPTLREDGSSPGLFVFALTVSPSHPLVELELVMNSADSQPWKVQIPTSCILAIADMSARKNTLGFVAA